MFGSTFCVSFAIRMRFNFLLTPHQRHLGDFYTTFVMSGTNNTRQTRVPPSYSLTCFHTNTHTYTLHTCASWQWWDYHRRKGRYQSKTCGQTPHCKWYRLYGSIRTHDRKPSYTKLFANIVHKSTSRTDSSEKERAKTNRTDWNKYKTNRSVIVPNVRREQINFGRCVLCTAFCPFPAFLIRSSSDTHDIGQRV